jgi:hypothetical protein
MIAISRLSRAACALAIIGLAGLGCSKKSSPQVAPAPEITGLAAVPATAEVVLGADVAKLTGSPVVERVVEQLLLRDPPLSERWQHLKTDCKIDLAKQVKRVMLAIGPNAGPSVGTGPVLMIVVGSIPEADLKDCVGKLVGTGGGSVTGKPIAGHTLYLAKDGNRTMYFAYGRPDTVVLGSSEAYVTEALGTGKKAGDNPELGRWLGLVNQNSALWATGRVDARIRDGLVKLTEGKLTGGPAAFTLVADLQAGASLDFGAVMTRADDAKSLESYVKAELALLTAAAQWRSLGPVVGKITVASQSDTVHLRVPLTVEDLNLLLSALDGGKPPAQDSAPPAPPAPPNRGAGSAAGATGAK